MAFNILTVQDGSDDDPTMYPTLADRSIDFEPLDGGDIRALSGKSLLVSQSVNSKMKEIVSVDDVKVDVFITDGRVAVAVDKYDTGGSWFGTSPLIIPLAIASKTAAAIRRRGKMLVGHVRYPWLYSVGHSPKRGWSSNETVRLVIRDGLDRANDPKRLVLLDITFAKTVDSAAVAASIARRAAAYRLQHSPIETDEERARFEDLLDAAPLAAEKEGFALHRMPTWYNAAPGSAYPKEPVVPPAQDPEDATPSSPPEVAGPAVDAPAPFAAEPEAPVIEPAHNTSGANEGPMFRVDGSAFPITGRVVVGRSPDADETAVVVRVADERASRSHFALGLHEGAVWIQDLESTNGTTITDDAGNQALLRPGRRTLLPRPVSVHFGDTVAFIE